jgi:anti-anti-sigma regulatory factor
MSSYRIESAKAGPYVTVLTVSGTVENGAQGALRRQLDSPANGSRSVVVDLTEAVLYDSWPFPLLVDEAKRLEEHGGRLVVVSGDNATVKPFIGDSSLPGLRWFTSLDDAMVELLGDVAALGDWPPPRVHQAG